MNRQTLKEFTAFAEYLADSSAKIALQYFRKNCGEQVKSNDTPVTLADQQIEKKLREEITGQFSSHGIIGEEFKNINADADYQWIIDPIDGTSSFIIGRPIFGTLIALTYKNSPLLGIINQPISGERWLAVKGEGSKLNNQIIKTRKCSDIADAVFCSTSPFYFKGKELEIFNKIRSKTKYQSSGGVFCGGDCYSYGLLASGFIDIIIETGLSNYDYTALIPVIEEAGGIITDWQGKKLDLNSDGRIIACGDQELHRHLLGYF